MRGAGLFSANSVAVYILLGSGCLLVVSSPCAGYTFLSSGNGAVVLCFLYRCVSPCKDTGWGFRFLVVRPAVAGFGLSRPLCGRGRDAPTGTKTPCHGALVYGSAPFLRLPSRGPRCCSFFRSVHESCLSLVIPSRLIYQRVPLPIRRACPLLTCQLLRSGCTTFHLSTNSCVALCDIPLGTLRIISPVGRSTLFLLQLML